ncbi:MAG: hypothetical protein J6Y65_04665, partial [Eggerthellaceae bacterium]|nr:hypothetical protein [Eggerthellaceae bacterium]
MRIFRYFKNHKAALAVVVLMFVIQAACDLALPKFTSDIVDVGIQQGGISDAAAKELTPQTYGELLGVITSDVFVNSYDLVDGRYVLNEYGSKNKEELSEAMAYPLVSLWFGKEMADAAMAAKQYNASDTTLMQQAASAVVWE